MLAEVSVDLRHPGEVRAAASGEAGGVLDGQRVAAGAGVVVDEPSGDQGAEPLADIPLLQAGAGGELLPGRGTAGQRVE
jgi:hypothetical protein